MAKSKTGGSRAYLRGRVGSDVYSIGVDAKGKKQQVVRSLAESVKNPQTMAQMRGRMIMSTVMQAVSAMRPIIDHSFDNVPAGQPNISEFIKRNYALIKDDVAVNASGNNAFGLNRYQEKGAKKGVYVVSKGSAIGVTGIVINGENKTLTIALDGNVTIGGVKQALGITSNDYFTAVAILANGKFAYERFHITSALADDVEITASNVGDVFNVEGNTSVALQLTGSSLVATLGDFSANAAIITSRKQLSGYIHSDATLAAVENPAYNADAALPTYPVGTERFLNGGGDEEGDSPFVPEPFTPSILSALVDGSNWVKNAIVTAEHGSYAAVSVTLDSFKSGHNAFFGSRYDASNPSNNRGFALNGVTSTGNIASLAGTADTQETNEIWLWIDGVKYEKWGSITFTNAVVKHTITAVSDPVNAGTITGAGEYNEGANCTLVATPASGKTFTGWYNGAQLVNVNARYTFVVTENVSLTAKFVDTPTGGFTEVKLNNQVVDHSGLTVESVDSLTGTYQGSGAYPASKVWLSPNDVAVGEQVTRNVASSQINSGAFSISNANVDDGVTYYLYAVRDDSGEGEFIAKDKFQYYFVGAES